jgi:hypothetical protein
VFQILLLRFHFHCFETAKDAVGANAPRTFDQPRVTRAMVGVIPTERRRPGRHRVALSLHPGAGNRRSNDVARLQFLGVFQTAARELEFPALARLVPDAARERIEWAEIEIPSVVVGFTTIEDGSFENERAVIDRRRHDAKGDVRRIQRMVAERCRRVVGRRRAVHERHRSQRRLAHRSARKRQPGR